MKFLTGLVLGTLLTFGAVTVFGQNERAMHPRIAAAIESLKEARTYMQNAPHDFGGHKAAAIKASNDAIRELNLALQFRGKMDR